MRRLRPIVMASVTAVLMVGLTSCGSDDGGTTPALTSAPPVPGSIDGVHAPKAGVLTRRNFAARSATAVKRFPTAHIRMDVLGEGPTVTATGVMDLSRTHPAVALHVQVAGVGRSEVRLVGGVMYVSVPRVTPRGKFLRIDGRTIGGSVGADFRRTMDEMNPAVSLATMQRGLQAVAYTGPARLGKRAVARYAVGVNPRRTVTRGLSSPLVRRLVKNLPDHVTYSYWMDRRDRMWKSVSEVSGERTTISMSGWGTPVHVRAPSARDIVNPPRG